MDVRRLISLAFAEKRKKNWEKLYFLVDLHGTVVRGYDKKDLYNKPLVYYPGARETLREMSGRKDIHLILWTGTKREEAVAIMENMKCDGIVFDNLNENPEVGDTDRYCASEKVYFNVGLDDRFGFDAEAGDWKLVMVALLDNPEFENVLKVERNLKNE